MPSAENEIMKIILVAFIFLSSFTSVYSYEAKDIKVKFVVKNGEGSQELLADKFKNLDLGDEIVSIKIENKNTRNLIIRQRFRTSLGVSNEGPHLDFRDWKHGYTQWTQLEKNSEGKFVALTVPIENRPFPQVSQKEILDYFKIYKTKNKGVDHWQDIISLCTSADSPPCTISIDQIEFRIQSLKPLKTIKSIKVSVPMGC